MHWRSTLRQRAPEAQGFRELGVHPCESLGVAVAIAVSRLVAEHRNIVRLLRHVERMSYFVRTAAAIRSGAGSDGKN